MSPFLIFVCGIFIVISVSLWRRQIELRREAYIRNFTLPQGLFEKLRKQHPHLTLKDCQLVSQGLRQFFLAYLKSRHRHVSMPSQVVDDLWHEFILYTRNYDAFCQKAFGRFFHHTPAIALSGARQSNAGLRRCWWQVCRQENISPRTPMRLPLLFALDAKLNIANGFRYEVYCNALQRKDFNSNNAGAAVYCAGDFSSSSFDGSIDGFGDAGDGGGDGGSGDGSGCGGGCGGD